MKGSLNEANEKKGIKEINKLFSKGECTLYNFKDLSKKEFKNVKKITKGIMETKQFIINKIDNIIGIVYFPYEDEDKVVLYSRCGHYNLIEDNIYMNVMEIHDHCFEP